MDNSIMDKIIKVHFESDKYYCYGIQGLVQWDKCQKLEISGLDISDEIVEVHFSLDEVQGNAERMYGTVKDGVIHADIPAFILEGPEHIFCNADVYNAYAWVYVSDEESAETIRKMEFEIKAKPKPNGYASPDKQDPFLQEIRQVLTDTKQIAQSVRDDADNGVFNGEQGPKGDAGSVHFLVVSELPEENIDESAIYLVPITLKGENNEYAEYIYVNGAWECIGSASVEVNLDDYVKKDDFASKDVAGVVKVFPTSHGLNVTNGILVIYGASNANIDAKTNNYQPIVPSNLDYAVMKALSDSKLEWTEEEKAKTRELLGVNGVKTSEYPKKVFEYEWKDNYDQIDVTSIDYETGILTVSSMPTQITDDVSTTVRVFPSLKIEGIAEQFKYGMMPKEIMETNSFYYAKKVGDNHVILCNPTNSTELTSITSSDVVDLTRWNLFVEKKRNSAIPNVDVKNLDKTHRYKLRYYMPQNAHYASGITIYSENEDKYGKEYGLGYQSIDVHLNEINNNPYMFILNSYETVSVRSKNYAYNEHIFTKYPRFFEVDICKLSDEAYKADVNIGYFAPFISPKDNTVFCMSTVKQNIFLQQPFGRVNFNTGNGNYILDGARCEVWDYGEVF